MTDTFEFEGVKVFESPDNPRKFVRLTLQGTNHPGIAVTDAEIRALIAYAFIESERDTWAWTNTDRSEARRGKWHVKPSVICGTTWALYHDDFRNVSLIGDTGISEAHRSEYTAMSRIGEALQGFIDWAATQTPPPPAVPNVGDYIRAEIRGDDVSHVDQFEVTGVEEVAQEWNIRGGAHTWFLNKPGVGSWETVWDIISWSHAERPKPWLSPEPGSLWELTVDGHTGDWVALPGVVENTLFRRVSKYGYVSPQTRRITAGREVTR